MDNGEPRKGRRVDLYPDDWIAGTVELSLEEEGAYLRVCMLIYSKGVPIPDNERWLAGMCRVSMRRWRLLRQALVDKGKIAILDGRIHQSRCEFELEKAMIRARKLAENGSKGGRKSSELRANALTVNDTGEAKAQASRARTLHLHLSDSKESGSAELPLEAPQGTKPEEPVALDLGKIIFGPCRNFLVENGKSDGHARSLLGRWRRDYGDGAVIEVVTEAQKRSVSEPVAWIVKALEQRQPRNAAAASAVGSQRHDLVRF
ncbi:MAG: YdaU family protein [Alphaproteobacteria bacterium]